MAENRRGKENRYYFSRAQMVLMGGAFIVASVAIFLLGMFVGKEIEERKIARREEPLVKIPVKPEGAEAGETGAQKRDEITFNDSIAKTSPAPTAQATKSERSAEKVVKAEPRAPKAEQKAEKAAAVETIPTKAEPVAKREVSDADKIWRAQVNAYPDERSAKLLVDRLKNKGYNAYVSEVQNRGRTWYRVNVGRFSTREDAEKTVEALKTKENYSEAFAASK